MAAATPKKIFVGPKPATLTEQALLVYFSRFGTIDALELVDMSPLPPALPDYPTPTSHIFVSLHFYTITLSPSMTSASLDQLTKEWHLIDNHLLQVRQVEVRPVVLQVTRPESNQADNTMLTSFDQQGQKVTGTVKWFNAKAGYGIINQDVSNEEIFVHKKAIKISGSRSFPSSLRPDDRVEFNVIQGKKRYEAVNVTRINHTSAQYLKSHVNWLRSNIEGESKTVSAKQELFDGSGRPIRHHRGRSQRGRSQRDSDHGRRGSGRGRHGSGRSLWGSGRDRGVDDNSHGRTFRYRGRRSYDSENNRYHSQDSKKTDQTDSNRIDFNDEQQDDDQLSECESEVVQSIFEDTTNNSSQSSSCETSDSTVLYTINVRIPSINYLYERKMHGYIPVEELIAEVCEEAGISAPPDHYYLIFDGHELNVTDTIREAGLGDSIDTTESNYPELRLKIQYQLIESTHIGTSIVLTSPEELVYQEILEVPYQPTQQDIMPEILKPLTEQISEHNSQSSANSSKLISMPVFTNHAILALPSVHITVPLKPNKFDWNEFLQNLAIDLEVEVNDMFIMRAEEGSTKYEIKFKAAISLCSKKLKKIVEKMALIILPTSKSAEFIAQQMPSDDVKEVSKFQVTLENFSKDEDSQPSQDLKPDDIDAALKLMQRPAIIDPETWEFLTEKSRKLSTCILHAFQKSTVEYVIESMVMVQNEVLYKKYINCKVSGEEKILFHGTKLDKLDGIFEINFINYHTTDAGWYGKGIYFSSSPQYCATYAGSFSTDVMYLICSLVQLGNIKTVKDLSSYHGKPMHPNFDTHYVKVDANGGPTNETNFFEEYVIKQNEQILPLYIVGLRKVQRFLLWRDAKITDGHNSAIFEQMKEKYNFNIYGSETSAEALNVIKSKLMDAQMKCVVVTNGADEGEEFARECRKLQNTLPIIVYCMNVELHRQWATAISGSDQPLIKVTGSSSDLFDFIDSIFLNENN